MKLRHVHRVFALAVGAFIILHLINHMALFWGPQAHLRVQGWVQPLYRNPVVEPVLLIGFGIQLYTGLRLLWQRRWPGRFWPRVQFVSGLALAFFLVQHVGAALLTRAFGGGLETNVYWAAAVVRDWKLAWYFAPYYVVGVSALFAHLAAALALRGGYRLAAKVLFGFGLAFALALVLALSGGFFEIQLPAAYEAYLTQFGI